MTSLSHPAHGQDQGHTSPDNSAHPPMTAACRVRAGAPVPQATTMAGLQHAEQLRLVARSAFADGQALGERLGTRSGWRMGWLQGAIVGILIGVALIVVPLTLGYHLPTHWQ